MTQDTSDTSPDSGTESPVTDTSDTTTSSSQGNSSPADEVTQMKEQIMRLQADYANLVRRSREEGMQMGEWTENKTILKFLPILDNLERSLDHIPTELVTHVWIE